MHIIQNNPYRIVGLLVGATAAEQRRQLTRLQRFLEADQKPEDDFSFPTLGKLYRTIDKVTDAASKLNLDSDKMNAALFWFYKGNSITDEPAFDAIKDGDLDQVLNIWAKLTSNGVVSQRNASAHNNLGNLYLSGILEGTNSNEMLFEKGISLKLKFLESDFVKDFKALATDETYNATKKELQLLFLNLLQSEIEKTGEITSNKLLNILTKQEFSAKEDFLKGFVQKPIEQIEKKIEETRKNQKSNAAKAGEFGNDLFKSTNDLLSSIIGVLGKTNIKTVFISDKLANEILQCSITLFNHFHETDTEVGEIALELNKKAKSIALGSVVKERINESTPIIEKYIKDRPEREKIKLVKSELEFIASNLERFQILLDTVSNARDLIDNCKPKLLRIKQILGSTDEFYLNLSSSVVQNAQNMLVQAVNEEVEEMSNNQLSRFGLLTSSVEGTINLALDTTFKLGTFDMHSVLKSHYTKNLDGIKSLAKQLSISTLTPKEKLQNELRYAETNLRDIQNTTFLKSELVNAQNEMSRIKEWKFLRSQSDRERQINDQQLIIKNLIKKADLEKVSQTNRQQTLINEIKSKIKKAEY